MLIPLWAFFFIKVLEFSSKILVRWQFCRILLPNVLDWWRCNLYTFSYLLELGSTSRKEWLEQENNYIIITPGVGNMIKLQIICIIFLQSKFQLNASHRLWKKFIKPGNGQHSFLNNWYRSSHTGSVVNEHDKYPRGCRFNLWPAQWVKDLALPWTVVEVTDAARNLCCCGYSVGQPLQLQFDPWPGNLHMSQVWS